MLRPRPIKSAGVDSFQVAVANGFPDIVDADLDLDADTLYRLINGQLDDANINADFTGPKINYHKLALTGQIQPTDLAGPFPGGSIAPGTVTGGPGGALAPATVTIGNMALFGSLWDGTGTTQVNDTTAAIALGNPGPASVIIEYGWTTRGGPVLCLAEFQGETVNANPTGVVFSTLALTLTRDPPTPGTPGGTPLWSRTIRANVAPGGCVTPLTLSVPLMFSYLLALPPGNNARVQLSMQMTVAQGTGLTVNHLHSRITLAELA